MNSPLLADPDEIADAAPEVFARVWRVTLDRPGFAVVRFTSPVVSRELRRAMIGLAAAFPVPFVPERLGRFDQQVSSKFHRDGAPPASLLLLGYEPTTVRGRFWVADAAAAAAAAAVPLATFLATHNPMFPAGESRLGPYVTELELPHGEPFVVALNNSQLPVDPVAGNPLGVLHKAVIEHPDLTARRVINSVGLTPAGAVPGKTAEEVAHFLARDDLD